MSRPLNPLSKFRSYSYYHVLAICDSTATANMLSTQTKPAKWQHPVGPNDSVGQDSNFGDQGPFSVKFVDEQKREGKYCILINGATDSRYTIVRAKWISATAAAVTMEDQSTSLAMEGDMEISEPKGVEFLDTIVRCCQSLSIDSSGAVYVLKTFFVGHPDNDDEEAQQDFYITDVEPLIFSAMDVTGSFAETGGLYQITFVAQQHGASRLPQYGKAASGFNLNGGESLKEAFENLAGAVQLNYQDLFDCVQLQFSDNEKFKNLLEPVEYVFELDTHYATSEFKVSDAPQSSKDTAHCPAPTQINIPANSSIEDAIHIIMKRCPQVTKELAQGVQDESGHTIHYEYRIHTAPESAPGDDGKIHYKIVYRVLRFQSPKNASLFEIAGTTSLGDLSLLSDSEARSQLSEQQQKLRQNLISYDYIYTGKNIDIIEFDMKMNLGLAYLTVATIANSVKEQLEPVPTSVMHVSSLDKRTQTIRQGSNVRIPVYFGTQFRAPTVKNKQDLSENAEAAYSLTKHSSLEVLDIVMRVYGNPRLLSTVNRVSGTKHFGTPAPAQNDNPVTREANYPDYTFFPAFAKVNIKMPRNNDDIALFNDSTSDQPFTRDFWFTGYYYVVTIEHIFDNGEFTQVMSLIGLPKTNDLKVLSKQGETSADFQIQKGINKCYDSRINPESPDFQVAVGAGLPFATNPNNKSSNAPIVQSNVQGSISPQQQDSGAEGLQRERIRITPNLGQEKVIAKRRFELYKGRIKKEAEQQAVEDKVLCDQSGYDPDDIP